MKSLGNVLFRRPRALNLLHRFHLVRPTSQTTEEELKTLERYATGRRVGLEIGSYQGVSAVRIAAAMSPDSTLFCVDPWPEADGQENACYAIFQRHVQRAGLQTRVRTVKVTSVDAGGIVPDNLDFAFVDGDHSLNGIKTDWALIRCKLSVGGIVCLHDSFQPLNDPSRMHDSMRYFADVISLDPEFELIDQVHSLAALRRVKGPQM